MIDTSQETSERLKTLKIVDTPHTLKSTYTADLAQYVELIYYDAATHTVHSAFSPFAFYFGQLADFVHGLLLLEFNFKQGYYFMNHVNRTGNYASEDFKKTLDMLEARGYAKNIKAVDKNKSHV